MHVLQASRERDLANWSRMERRVLPAIVFYIHTIGLLTNVERHLAEASDGWNSL